jgi:hypothetical protein
MEINALVPRPVAPTVAPDCIGTSRANESHPRITSDLSERLPTWCPFLLDDVHAEPDAPIADVDTGPSDQLLDPPEPMAAAPAAERAPQRAVHPLGPPTTVKHATSLWESAADQPERPRSPHPFRPALRQSGTYGHRHLRSALEAGGRSRVHRAVESGRGRSGQPAAPADQASPYGFVRRLSPDPSSGHRGRARSMPERVTTRAHWFPLAVARRCDSRGRVWPARAGCARRTLSRVATPAGAPIARPSRDRSASDEAAAVHEPGRAGVVVRTRPRTPSGPAFGTEVGPLGGAGRGASRETQPDREVADPAGTSLEHLTVPCSRMWSRSGSPHLSRSHDGARVRRAGTRLVVCRPFDLGDQLFIRPGHSVVDHRRQSRDVPLGGPATYR